MDPIMAPVIQVLLLGPLRVTDGMFEGLGAEVGLGGKLGTGADVGLAEEVESVEEVGKGVSEDLITAVGVTVLSVIWSDSH